MRQHPNDFTSFELDKDEFLAGITYSIAQRAVLQNLLSEAATEKVNLKVNTHHVEEFIQREAELQGRMYILRYLLEAQSEMEVALNPNTNPVEEIN